MLSRVTDPQLRYGMPPGVMEHFETATRDPAFFRLHKHIDNLFRMHKDLLTPYDVSEVTELPGRAMVQVVSRRPLTSETRVRARVNPLGICGGQRGTGTGFFSVFFSFLLSYHSTVAFQTHIIWGIHNMLT
jgi:hypothetical protein